VAKKILIVEDNSDIRAMMATYLALNTYEVIEATNGYEAIEIALEQKPDVILMDIAMPVLNGLDSARAMRETSELADVPILCLTAFGDFYQERAIAAGCDELMHKPIDFVKLEKVLREHLH
jgi:CheY-like chemotaxis protein